MASQPWDNLQYRRMDHAEHRRGKLHVRFENGDEVEVDGARLLPTRSQVPHWDLVGCNGIELEVPTQDGPKYVFWETFRELTDH